MNFKLLQFEICIFICVLSPIAFGSFSLQFCFHNNGYNDLHDILGKECLPDEYGGTNGPIDYEKTLKYVLAREKMLEQNRQYGVKSSWTVWQSELRTLPRMKALRTKSEWKRERQQLASNGFKYSHVQNNVKWSYARRGIYYTRILRYNIQCKLHLFILGATGDK